MTSTDHTFRFNKRYDDLEQVAEYLPAFEARLQALEEAGQYRYNDSFKGHIAGIEGPDEDTAIYLLQGLERDRRQAEKVEELISQGYRFIDSLPKTVKFSHVILVPTTRLQGPWAEHHDARVMPETCEWQAERIGPLRFVLPKGKRTHGDFVNGRSVLVSPS